MTGKPENYIAKEAELSEAFEEIKAIDTSRYKSHPMVEKLLVFQVEELKKTAYEERARCDVLTEQNEALKIEVAIYKERRASDRILEWMRAIAGIGLGVSTALIFSNDPLLSKAGMVASPLVAILFTLSCFKSFARKQP